MQAVILAAGKSKRFYPYNFFGHKSMVRFFGKTLLEHTLESLRKAKITNVIIVIGKDSLIPQALGKVEGLSLTFVTQDETLGMGHALLAAQKYLEESFFLLSGYHSDIADFAHEMQKKQKKSDEIVLLAKEDQVLEKFGVLEVDGDKVTSITEKPGNISTPAYRAVAIYLLNTSFLTTLEETPLSHYHFEKALDTYAKEGKVSFVVASSQSTTLKHSWDLLDVKDYLLSRQKPFVSKTAKIAKSAQIEGNVVISENVQVFENVCIKGPAYIGESAIVGSNAIIRGGVVLEKNVVLGANMEVKNSFLMEGATTHSGYIGDSVIGSFTRIAGGFTSANVRFDRLEIISKYGEEAVDTHKRHMGVVMGEKINVGVQVATMPGIIIGSNVTIGPGTVVTESVEDNTLFYTKFEKVKKKKHE